MARRCGAARRCLLKSSEIGITLSDTRQLVHVESFAAWRAVCATHAALSCKNVVAGIRGRSVCPTGDSRKSC